jgi:hypothetical protein
MLPNFGITMVRPGCTPSSVFFVLNWSNFITGNAANQISAAYTSRTAAEIVVKPTPEVLAVIRTEDISTTSRRPQSVGRFENELTVPRRNWWGGVESLLKSLLRVSRRLWRTLV